MKQNSQWLSQVRTRSNTALDTSTPSDSPAALTIEKESSRPPRLTSRSISASSAASCHSMMSRGITPLTRMISSPTAIPCSAAADPAATATTMGASDRLVRGAGAERSVGVAAMGYR